MYIKQVLADYKNEDINDYNIEVFKGYNFINTAGHGYLAIGSDENGYSKAYKIAKNSNYSYILDGGIVYLEEDCDATEFLKSVM